MTRDEINDYCSRVDEQLRATEKRYPLVATLIVLAMVASVALILAVILS